MKKVFWGYDPREVNESIEFLESQNESLNAKLANLNLELLSKNEQLAAKEEGISAVSGEEKNELTSLRSKTESLNAENTRLQNECSSLLAKIEKLESQKTDQPKAVTENFDQVGELFLSVYNEISNVKLDVSESMKKYVVEYVMQLESSNNQLREILSGIIEARDGAKVSFIESVETILGEFNCLAAESDELKAKFDSLDKVKEELNFKVNSLVENMKQTEESKGEVKEESEDEKETQNSLPPLLSKALSEKKTIEESKNNKSVIKTISDAKPKSKFSVNM